MTTGGTEPTGRDAVVPSDWIARRAMAARGVTACSTDHFVVEIDGHEERRLPFRVMTPKMGMGMMTPPLLPPTA